MQNKRKFQLQIYLFYSNTPSQAGAYMSIMPSLLHKMENSFWIKLSEDISKMTTRCNQHADYLMCDKMAVHFIMFYPLTKSMIIGNTIVAWLSQYTIVVDATHFTKEKLNPN